ncbi:mitochondrial inner membrane protein OXA1L-like [Oppia nitens]|uniref:mitochondrial inner membrane protein OXA1L-like n=1 Tax=Oppia nitens TaxID=1686743 RepID=UPI0023DCB007|nr:mitochondrial inner membrane protein OXA1L-like [Oppia nitens]
MSLCIKFGHRLAAIRCRRQQHHYNNNSIVFVVNSRSLHQWTHNRTPTAAAATMTMCCRQRTQQQQQPIVVDTKQNQLTSGQLLSSMSGRRRSSRSSPLLFNTTRLLPPSPSAAMTTIAYRCLSTSGDIVFKPESVPLATTTTTADEQQLIDLSDSVDMSAMAETIMTNMPITELGLASNYTPMGWVLHMLESFHSVMPWWATIAVATLCFRIAMFPLVIKAQKNAMLMNQIMPELQLLQQKSTNARLAGNQLEFQKYLHQSQDLMKKNGINPLKNMLVPMAQAPVFITFFMTLRRMARLPVESLKLGGMMWFVDLTVPDPLHILPIITSVSLWAALELGVESGVSKSAQSAVIKTFMRVVPCITLVFIWNFESAILMYWCTSNFISLCQVTLLKQPKLRQYLKIPEQKKYKPEDLPIKPKGFYASIKESMDNSKVMKQLEDRKRMDEMAFKKAAIGPIKKTFKSDPTRIQSRS